MRNHRKIFYLLMSACFLAATAIAAFAQTASSVQPEATTGKCSFQQLNFPPPATKGQGVALNDLGGIAGTFSDSKNVDHGFLLFQGRLTTFMFPGSSDTGVTDMSRNGIIVGPYFSKSDSRGHAYMVHSGGFHEITIPGFPNADVEVFGVNANGDVVGVFFPPNANGSGFLLHNGKLTILSFPGATGGTMPSSINDEGVIVGTYFVTLVNNTFGFMWKDGVFSNVKPPPESIFLESLTKISNSGVIVGNFQGLDENEHGFALKNETYTTINATGASNTFILGVNKFDNIVGQAVIPGLGVSKTIDFKGFCGNVF